MDTMANKLIVLAALGSLKAYSMTTDELSQTPRLDLVHEHHEEAAHARIADQLTDKAGRFATPGGGASVSENHNLRSENQRRLVKQLASRISQIVQDEKPSAWFFGAAKEINQRIVDELDAGVRAKLSKNVAADLVKIHKSELLAHF
jgi:hypothetical protein